MNNLVSSEASQHPETASNTDAQPLWYLSYWPALLVGVLIAMGMTALQPDGFSSVLVWIPPAVAVLLFLLAIIMLPRPKKHREEPWETRAREAAARQRALGLTEPAKVVSEAPVGDTGATETATGEVAPVAQAAAAPTPAADADVLIMWGSETGTAQGLAEVTETKLKNAGVVARAMSMGDVGLGALPGYRKILVITSTWGDGEPPSNAYDLWEALQKQKVDLSGSRFSVLALGDTAYPEFCKCGKDFDQFLESQGAKRLHPRVDCDLDYDAPFAKWLSGVQQALGS